MHHDFIDKYSFSDGPLHRLDPRAKVAALVLWIGAVNVIPAGKLYSTAGVGPSAMKLLALLLVLLCLLGGSRVPVPYILKRSLIVLPFAFFIAFFAIFFGAGPTELIGPIPIRPDGVRRFLAILAKSYLSVAGCLLLASTTRFADILWALDRMGVPRLLLMILSFLYRYLFLFADEAMRMLRGRNARSFGRRGLGITTAFRLVGVLLARTYARAERVYKAMCARGFAGRIRTLRAWHLHGTDWIAAIAFSLVVTAIAILDPSRWRPW